MEYKVYTPLKRHSIVVFLIIASICLCIINFFGSKPNRFIGDVTTIYNRDTSPKQVAKYQFPSIDERFEYYMGDWYNKTDWQLKRKCPTLAADKLTNKRESVINHDMLFSLKNLKKCSDISWYCYDAYNTLKLFKSSHSSNPLALFKFGDGYSNVASNPVISKSRPALGRNLHTPIIWPLNTKRHFAPLQQIWEAKMDNKEIEWKDKESKLFWRGKTTGRRVELLSRWTQYDSNVIDVAFSEIQPKHGKFLNKYLGRHDTRQTADPLEMLKYKYLLSIEGNDVASGLKWMLYSNSVVLMAPPTVSTWAMEDLLLPFVHYIPLADDYSNLSEMIQWAEDHQDTCQVISKRATAFIEQLCLSKQAKIDTEILRERMATAYVSQFQQTLSHCNVRNGTSN